MREELEKIRFEQADGNITVVGWQVRHFFLRIFKPGRGIIYRIDQTRGRKTV
jgi:hypothetical protein